MLPLHRGQKRVNEETLRTLLVRQDYNHPLVRARLQYTAATQELGQFTRYLARRRRVYPEILPTQASGGWSITHPVLTPWIQTAVVPDRCTYWVTWQYEDLTAWLVAILTQNTEEIDALHRGYDLHLWTACQMFRLPLPALPTAACHRDEASLGWRTRVDWRGREDRRYQLARALRAALWDAPRSRPEYAALMAQDIIDLDCSRQEILTMAKTYLGLQRHACAMKHRVMDEVCRTGEARTAFGRVRRFIRGANPSQRDRDARQGWRHMVEGTVHGIVARTLIALLGEGSQWGVLTPYGARLVMNVPEGITVAFPVSVPYKKTLTYAATSAMDAFRAAVNREWILWGTKTRLPATFHITKADGSYEVLGNGDN